MERACVDCKWSCDWTMTKHKTPRINPNEYGRCSYHIPIPILPICIQQPEPYRMVIWPHYENCPTWEPK